ncbi:MAG: NADP-dependent isocitrate dehydrogenase [Candidatus Sumerlaeia bacterium]|nr:NADP-dependent isocitrate dehydrogenase [Candidatus Sumerlaeia bacterium]
MTSRTPVTIAYGDGIGPEIMNATVRILDAAGARIEWDRIEVGEQVYLSGESSGISAAAWESLRANKVMLKSPITTPQGGGYKSLNVTIRKTLGLYANVRPCVSYHPFIQTKNPKMDVVIVRENEEDLYAGIEHRQTNQVVQCLKIISRPGCEKIIRYAFDYAVKNNRKTVSCLVKDNIMKLSDGLFYKVFEEIASEYPSVNTDRWIIDIGAARLADTPEIFDVMVMPNLYGDILSDIAAQITGSVGLGGSANIGEHCAMFEAIHGSAPTIAGQDIANPSGLLLGAVMMLVHIQQPDVAELIHNAWLRTIEDGVHTGDIYREGVSRQRVGTQGFGDAVIKRLGQKPETLTPVTYAKEEVKSVTETVLTQIPVQKKDLVGVDVFLDCRDMTPDQIGGKMQPLGGEDFQLMLITNRGVKVWPNGYPETFCTDHWRCRFRATSADNTTTHAKIIALLQRVAAAGFDFIKTEHLCNFDGKAGYSLGQGE